MRWSGNTFTVSDGGRVAESGLDAAEMAPSASVWDDQEIRSRFEAESRARGSFTWDG